MKRQSIILLLILIPILANTQKVGIGTTSPQGEFHVTLPYSFSGISFSGTGLNDLTANTNMFNGSGTKYFKVEVTNAGPNPNIIKWSNDGGMTWTENVQASTLPIDIGYGISFQFANTNGHIYGDSWSWSLVQSYPDGLVVKYGNTALGHDDPVRRLDVLGGILTDSIQITNGAGMGKVLTSDHLGNSKWKILNSLKDNDEDTKIQVEANPDEDSIRFTVGGNPNWIMADHRLIPKSSGNSIFIGDKAGDSDDLSNNFNIGLGYHSLKNTSSGYENIAIGSNTLEGNLLGHHNVGIGDSSLFNNNNGLYNIGFGYKALKRNLNGHNNIALGTNSLLSNANGDYNISIGTNNLSAKNDLSDHNIAIGFQTMENWTGGYAIGIGYQVLQTGNNALGCIGIGYQACKNNTDGWYTTGIGYHALTNNTTGQQNSALGAGALSANSIGRDNVAVGFNALSSGNNNDFNVAVGSHALNLNSTGDNNTAIGYKSNQANSSGYNNTSSGYYSSYSLISGHDNCSFGAQALEKTNSGHYNVAIGSNALNKNITGYSNVAIGMQSVFNNLGSDGNTGIGLQALFSTTGGFNTALGWAAYSSGSYIQSIGIGAATSITADYQARIGNTSISSIGGYVGWSNLSDKRFKRNIVENVPGLSLINKLRPVTYTLDIDALNDFLQLPDSVQNHPLFVKGFSEKRNMIQSGFIAQEVEAAAKEIGYSFSGIDKPKNENDHYGLRYAEFVVPLVKAVQELSAENNNKEEKIQELQSVIIELQQKYADLDLKVNSILKTMKSENEPSNLPNR